MTNFVSYETDGHVAIITLNRPEAMNAFNREMRAGLMAAQAKAEHDAAIRVVVLIGTGRAFSSGTDLKEGLGGDPVDGFFDNSIRDYKPLVDGVAKSKKI